MRTKAKGLIIDITAIDVVDSFLSRILIEIAGMARLMGVTTVLAGMQPEVAITLVEFGLELDKVHTVLNLEKGLELLRRSISGGLDDDNRGKKGIHQR